MNSSSKKKKIICNIIFVIITIVITITICYIYKNQAMNHWLQSDVKTRGSMIIRGNSMTPLIEDNQIVYIQDTMFQRGEVVVAVIPATEDYIDMAGILMIKRIVGLPGEHVEITKDGVLINGTLLNEDYTVDIENTLDDRNTVLECILSDNEYYLIGDNRKESFDSRNLGPIHSSLFLYSITTEPNSHTIELIAARDSAISSGLMWIIGCSICFVFIVFAFEYHFSKSRGNQNTNNTTKSKKPRKK